MDGKTANDLLQTHSPKAAKWYRDNAPHLVKPHHFFFFPFEDCEEIRTDGIDKEQPHTPGSIATWTLSIISFLIGAGFLSLTFIGLRRGEIMEISSRSAAHYRVDTRQDNPAGFWHSETALGGNGLIFIWGSVLSLHVLYKWRRHQQFLSECSADLRRDIE